MKPPPILAEEDQRLCRLVRLGVLDTGSEGVLDSFTDLAASLTGHPIALVSLVDRERQWMKSAVGVPQGFQTPRTISFCGHAIASPEEIFEVEDALLDERFRDNPLVTGEPHVRHYAGAPLVMPGGERIGTLCVIGPTPGRLDDKERLLLARLSRSVVEVLLLRERNQDLDARLHAEQALRESEASFRAIANAVPQIIWSARPDGTVQFLNERWCAFTGMAVDRLDDETWMQVLHPDDLNRTLTAWHHSLAVGSAFDCEYRLRHRSGDYRWVLALALPVTDADGTVLRWLGTCTDIHDQRLAHEEIQLASRRKDEFLAMLAHELRNPLAPLGTSAQVLRMAADKPAQVLKSADLIERQVTHMTALVDDLLDVSRVTRGLVTLERELLDLRGVLEGAVEQSRPLLEARRHVLAVNLGPEPVVVEGDRVRLLQIVANLLNNAAKYTPEGGRVRLTLDAGGGQARVRVEDDGSGIDAELMPQLFELFSQARRTPDRAQGGLGLGLSLVRSLARLHGGDVTVHSAGPGQGSTFTVLLPLAEAPAPAALPPAPEPLATAGRSLRVMVVDDNADAADMLATWLSMKGHQAVVHNDAARALDAALANPTEVYVLDIGLPGMDGYELARRLRASPRNRRATLVALTGYGQALDMRRSHDAGFDYHFVKPMNPLRMAALLAQIAPATAVPATGSPVEPPVGAPPPGAPAG